MNNYRSTKNKSSIMRIHASLAALKELSTTLC